MYCIHCVPQAVPVSSTFPQSFFQYSAVTYIPINTSHFFSEISSQAFEDGDQQQQLKKKIDKPRLTTRLYRTTPDSGMEKEQQREWAEAQNIGISVQLVDAAKRQLKFLAAVDRNRYLYGGPALEQAIYRYTACWLPLLAKHCEAPICEEPLVVPLDCEWIWHCHRLNPVQYKSDCEKLFGRVIDNSGVVSSVQEASWRQSEKIWKTFYPDEPYELDLTRASSDYKTHKSSQNEKRIEYDLVSAVKRQSPFFYQVFRPHMSDDLFLQDAVARYKGFLHLIKRNKERSIQQFCVPTYDIDLIWHSHQLHPVSYGKDLNAALGKILEHDDMDSDRTKGKKLDTGFSVTTKQFEDTFGFRYWRAGAMYRGTEPGPVTETPHPFKAARKELDSSIENQKLVQLHRRKLLEVLLEVVAVKNLPEQLKGDLFVTIGKKHPDTFFGPKKILSILSESGEKQVAYFQCEPNGELDFDLICHSSPSIPRMKSVMAIGSGSLPLLNFLTPLSSLSAEKWLELAPVKGSLSSAPILLRIAVSFTIPTPAAQVLHLVKPYFCHSCLFPLPGGTKCAKSMMNVVDAAGTDVINVQMRNPGKGNAKEKSVSKKQVISTMESGEELILAELVENQWSLRGACGSYMLHKGSGNGNYLFDLVGDKMYKVFPGRRLECEREWWGEQRTEKDFVTAVEFSVENPYGKAAALFDLRFGSFMLKDETLALPFIGLGFILSHILKKEGYSAFSLKETNLRVMDKSIDGKEALETTLAPGSVEKEVDVDEQSLKDHETLNLEKGNYHAGGCGSECGSGCGGGCGNRIKSSGCGGCGGGGGCGNRIKSSGCGGCGGGGGCGNRIKSSGCGGCGGGGCGNSAVDSDGGCGTMMKSTGCGGCGGGCGNHVAQGNVAGTVGIPKVDAIAVL